MAKEAKDDNGNNPGDKRAVVAIKPLRMEAATFRIRGTAPYVQHAFGRRPKEDMKNRQIKGSQGKKDKERSPKDFKQMYEDAKHQSEEGWCGIPAAAFRCALISACRVVGFTMTRAKLAVFVDSDGVDKEDGVPLVKITKGKPHYVEHAVRLESGVMDIHARPMWDPGWEADVKINWDLSQFSRDDIANLLYRAGRQVGIGEGRPDSRKSAGMGWGLFEII